MGLAIERTYSMIIKLPQEDYFLNSELPFCKRNEEVNNLLLKKIEFYSETMTVEEYFRITWEIPESKKCMDMIGYYLSKNNRSEDELEQDRADNDGKDSKEDKYILSNKKIKEMQKGSKRHTTFSSMGIEYRAMMGIDDIDDTNYN